MRAIFLYALFCTVEFAIARQIRIHNNLGETIYVGIQGNSGHSTPEKGGFGLDSQQERDVDVPDDWEGRFWARTGCNFDGNSGHCETGDCGDVLECNGAGGVPPVTLVEITLQGDNNQDFYDVSLVDGFNIPASITPAGQQGQDRHCTTAGCPNDLNPRCPEDLQVDSGGNIVACKSSCVVTDSDRDCCRGEFNNAAACQGSESAMYFKGNCPNAYSFAYDDETGIYTCDTGFLGINVKEDLDLFWHNMGLTAQVVIAPACQAGDLQFKSRTVTATLPGFHCSIMKIVLFLVFICVAHFTSATQITVQNSLGSTVNVGGFETFDLAPGASRTYGLGAGASGRVFGHSGDSGNPTLAEFSINSWNGMDFYDLSVIDGYNLPMKIIPANGGCPTVVCSSSSCPDAYHYPTDDTKTHGCATTDYTVVFGY